MPTARSHPELEPFVRHPELDSGSHPAKADSGSSPGRRVLSLVFLIPKALAMLMG